MFPSPLLFLGSRHRRYRRPSSFVLAFHLVLRFVRRVSCTHRVPGQQRPPRIGTHERLHLSTGTAPRRWWCAAPVRGRPPRAARGGGKGVPRTRPSSPGGHGAFSCSVPRTDRTRTCAAVAAWRWRLGTCTSLSLSLPLSPSPSLSISASLPVCLTNPVEGGRGRRDAAWGDGRARGWERVAATAEGGRKAVDGNARVQEAGRRAEELGGEKGREKEDERGERNKQVRERDAKQRARGRRKRKNWVAIEGEETREEDLWTKGTERR